MDRFMEDALHCMQERGPDQFDSWSEGSVGFVHRRLSILDLSEAGRQPMFADCKRISITFNGEVYNFQQLRQELQQAGASFRTGTDTEVLLQGYQCWGVTKLIDKLEGMFAFGLIDFNKRRLFLARDHFGKKPLYYYKDAEHFLFASDIRPIWKEKRDKLTLDFYSIDYYLTEISMPQPRTIWQEIRQVPPASLLEVNLDSGAMQISEYWKLPESENNKITSQEAEGEVETLLRAAITKRVIADVPIGCFLSGGVDSGLVVSLLSQQSRERVKTFSVGFDGVDNELPDARIIADRYNTDHHEIFVTAHIAKDLPQLIDYVGEPFADSSLLPSFYVCKALSKHVKVALSGDGGDELFGGYVDYLYAYHADQFVKKYPGAGLQRTIAAADKVWSRLTNRKGPNAGAMLHYTQIQPWERMYRQMGFSEKEKEQLWKEEHKQKVHGFTVDYLGGVWAGETGNSYAQRLMRASLRTRLLNDYLVKVDRASMINSLEVRSPFLDKTLAEFAFSLPPEIKFGKGESKSLLKNIAARHIDPNIRQRPKRGFGVPLDEWLRKDLKDLMMQLPGNAKLSEMFERPFMTSLVVQHLEGKENYQARIWALICLASWLEKYT